MDMRMLQEDTRMRTLKEHTRLVSTLSEAVRVRLKSSPLPLRLHRILVSTSTVNAYYYGDFGGGCGGACSEISRS